jgi:hypothetical protein
MRGIDPRKSIVVREKARNKTDTDTLARLRRKSLAYSQMKNSDHPSFKNAKPRKSIMGVSLEAEDEEDDVLPIRNSEKSKLVIAAVAETRRGSIAAGNANGRRSSIAAGFGFVKRGSIAAAGLLKGVADDGGGAATSNGSYVSPTASGDMIAEVPLTPPIEDSPIPSGMIRHPPSEGRPDSQGGQANNRGSFSTSKLRERDSLVSFSGGKLPPPGFMESCPFSGYDPEKLDKSNMPPPIIKSRLLIGNRPFNDAGSIEEGDNSLFSAPPGYTLEKNPTLWPCRDT